jgi:hypothetical protein
MPSFTEPYPHQVAMAEQVFGLDEIDAAGMVQFCMVQPMAAEPLDWSSEELAALTAYTLGGAAAIPAESAESLC